MSPRKRSRATPDRNRAGGLGARLLFRQRLDLGRGRAEDGARLFRAIAASRARASSRWSMAIMATLSAACRSARAACSTPPTSRCCSRSSASPSRAPERSSARSTRFEAICRRDAPAALIVEPLILGAGGMLIYSASVLAELKRICEAHRRAVHRRRSDDRLRAARERYSPASRQASRPISCASAKGLTGGVIPLAVTLCSAEIFDAHYCADRARMFYHSSSFTANPIACAAAVANLEVWAREPVRERIAALSAAQAERLAAFEGR